MPIRNTRDRFGAVAKFFHWLVFLLLIGSFTLAWSMVDMQISPRKLQLYSWHKWVGVTIFLIVLLRLGWRLVNPVPAPPAGTPRWQRLAAGLSHAGLYLVLFALPLTGWLMSSAKNLPLVYLGVVRVPNLVEPNQALGERLEGAHQALAFALLVLVGVHLLAALYHHIFLRDDVLRRMLPWPARPRRAGHQD